jgi:hypothetical protein
MRPRLEACYFGEGDHGEMYARLAHVLEHSALKHCPGWDVNVERLTPPEYVSAMGNPSHVWNTQKLEHWRRRVIGAPDGARVMLIDGDMLITKNLDDVWRFPFDLAYTIRTATRLPLNGGVVCVRVSERVRAFMDRWWKTNLRFLEDRAAHRAYRAKYAGINQASFGYLLEHGMAGLEVHKLRCAEWNLCEWNRHEPSEARIIHYKSTLRRATFGVAPVRANRLPPRMQALIKRWRQEEKEMMEWQRRRAATSASTAIAAM